MGLIDDGKSLFGLAMKLKDQELLRQLTEYQAQVVQLWGENTEIRQRLRELEEALKTKGKMTHKPPFYMMGDDPIPFCPRCWEVDQKAIHVIVQYNVYNGRQCPACKWATILPSPPSRPTTEKSKQKKILRS